MRLPILKRLVRYVSNGPMSQPRRVLEDRCLEYTALLRTYEAIRRQNVAEAEAAQINIQETETETETEARGQQSIIQQMSILSDQSWEERQRRRENQRRQENQPVAEERSQRIRAFLRNLGQPTTATATAAATATATAATRLPPTKPQVTITMQPIDLSAIETCCICLENDSYIQTNCGHGFCNCILQHTSMNGVKCPMCRQELTSFAYSCKTHYESTSRLGNLLNMGRVSYAFANV